jgi:hypothetical protein
MATVKQHLMKAHQTIAEHHRAMSKCHGDAMGKSVAGDAMHNFHKAAAAVHDQAAEQHDAMCQECEKAIASDMNKVVPTNVSAVVPTYPGVTAVPRAGQREIPEKANVDPQFAKIVVVDEDDNSMNDLHL